MEHTGFPVCFWITIIVPNYDYDYDYYYIEISQYVCMVAVMDREIH